MNFSRVLTAQLCSRSQPGRGRGCRACAVHRLCALKSGLIRFFFHPKKCFSSTNFSKPSKFLQNHTIRTEPISSHRYACTTGKISLHRMLFFRGSCKNRTPMLFHSSGVPVQQDSPHACMPVQPCSLFYTP